MSGQESLGGPYLAYAVICERVLTEADGAVSLIRVIDRFTIRGPAERLTPTLLSFWLAVMFRSGFQRGVMNLAVQPVSPSLVRLPAMDFPMHFDGDEERACSVALPVQFLAEETGLYWFEVSLAGQLATKIPLRIVYLPMLTTPGQGPEPPKRS